jgi:hypothetical protein
LPPKLASRDSSTDDAHLGADRPCRKRTRSIDITSLPEWSQKKANHHRTESDGGWHVYSLSEGILEA